MLTPGASRVCVPQYVRRFLPGKFNKMEMRIKQLLLRIDSLERAVRTCSPPRGSAAPCTRRTTRAFLQPRCKQVCSLIVVQSARKRATSTQADFGPMSCVSVCILALCPSARAQTRQGAANTMGFRHLSSQLPYITGPRTCQDGAAFVKKLACVVDGPDGPTHAYASLRKVPSCL